MVCNLTKGRPNPHNIATEMANCLLEEKTGHTIKNWSRMIIAENIC